MTTPTGTISLWDVALELGVTSVGINMNQADVRALAGVPTGALGMWHLRNKTKNLPYGTFLSSWCSGSTLVSTFANGTGGSYEAYEVNSASCPNGDGGGDGDS